MNCDNEGGWTRVAYLNMTESNATCPPGLGMLSFSNIDHDLCGKTNYTHCFSTIFSSHNLEYSQVCGQVRGYQYYFNAAFLSIAQGIDRHYVDGVSITHGSNPRKHIWTYAGAPTEITTDNYGCPCSTGNNPESFVGEHYYCESGSSTNPNDILYPNDPLWDGEQCNGNEGSCCPANSTMPWFHHSLNSTSDDIELRVCAGGSSSLYQTPIDIIELYIK